MVRRRDHNKEMNVFLSGLFLYHDMFMSMCDV